MSRCELELVGKSFNDFLFRPQLGVVHSREDIDITSRLSASIKLNVPVLSSNMDTITETEMALSISTAGGMGFIHRAMTIPKQVSMIRLVKDGGQRVGAAVGINGDFVERAVAAQGAGADIILIDAAHAHITDMKEAVRALKSVVFTEIIIGNIATYEGARYLIDLGADGIKVGIGSGSICTTRLETGAGVPQLQAIREAWRAVKASGKDIPIIACGGMKTDKDIFLSLLMGASSVMSGRMFAGSAYTPNPAIYRGMASEGAQRDQHTYKGVSEGISLTLTVTQGRPTTKEIMQRIAGHLRSSLSYAGCYSLKEFHDKIVPNATDYLIPLSQGGSKESFWREAASGKQAEA